MAQVGEGACSNAEEVRGVGEASTGQTPPHPGLLLSGKMTVASWENTMSARMRNSHLLSTYQGSCLPPMISYSHWSLDVGDNVLPHMTQMRKLRPREAQGHTEDLDISSPCGVGIGLR